VEKRTIRFCIWVWDRGVDDFLSFCLPSLMQPNNIPWLIQNGFPISLDYFTLERDRARVEQVAQNVHNTLRAMAPDAQISATLSNLPETKRTTYEIKVAFFEAIVRVAVETKSYVLFTFADMFFGDGSVRNIVVYGQKPGVTVSGLYLRVKQKPFMELLAHHQAVTGSPVVSNARLVDMCLDTLIDGMQASIVDNDRNASHLTSGALRKISDDLYTYSFHAPTPMLCWFEESDVQFFSRLLWNCHLFDHIWPTMLIAKNRWRVMASSDLFFLAEYNREEIETDHHVFPTKDGLLYNDDYDQEHLHGRIHQTMLMTLRRERLA
jgi:hypothetical protein